MLERYLDIAFLLREFKKGKVVISLPEHRFIELLDELELSHDFTYYEHKALDVKIIRSANNVLSAFVV